MRDSRKTCEATTFRAAGVVLVNINIDFFDQHHPGAHQEMRHPSSAEEGSFYATSNVRSGLVR